MSGAAFNRGNSKQDYATPPCFMNPVVERWGHMDFDLAASPENAKAPNWFSIVQNSLERDWTTLAVGNLWLNPPFDDIAPWAEKCTTISRRHSLFFLVPASVGANWFQRFVHRKAMVYFLNGRIPFDPNNPKWGYPKDCILAVYSAGSHGYETWKWKS